MKSIVWLATACIALLGTGLVGCVVTPSHDGLARVRVDDVVKRVRCDIRDAVFSKIAQKTTDGRYPYAFLQGWAAKVHFTIIVDDTSSINPGATLIHVLPSVGSSSQNYSTGIGVGVTTEAVRQEDIEFLMSFSDMNKDFHDPARGELYQYCRFNDGLLLESDLGLSGMVDAALAPIGSGLLRPGNNIGPGATPPDTPSSQLKPPENQIKEFVRSRTTTTRGESVIDEGAVAKDIETRTQSIITNIVKPLYGVASTSSFEKKCLDTITQLQNEAIVLSVNVSADVVAYGQSTTDDARKTAIASEKANFTKVVNAANDLINNFRTCARAVQKNQAKIYDPIDSISETVNFYVTASGSVTPTWKLVSVTAPLASTFAIASRKDTNTLILSMGRPVVAADGSISASQSMNNQILASLLAQAVAQRPTP